MTGIAFAALLAVFVYFAIVFDAARRRIRKLERELEAPTFTVEPTVEEAIRALADACTRSWPGPRGLLEVRVTPAVYKQLVLGHYGDKACSYGLGIYRETRLDVLALDTPSGPVVIEAVAS